MLSPRARTCKDTEATKLVKALIDFAGGPAPDEAEHHSDLDNEEEEITVGHRRAETSVKGKGKQKQQHDNATESADTTPTTSLAHLSLESTPKPAKQQQQKAPRSLRNLIRTSEHEIKLPDSNGQPTTRILTSWKMADYAYKREPCPFPTRARGLFTERVGGDKGEEEYRIIARGYDKFFNVNEVSWTHWENIPKHSSAPYELTLKSNGCIILISTLSPTHILVTSKHSIGANAAASTEVSHSQRGEWWLEKHLEKVGKTKEDLAKELWDRGLTAVAELCDDSFEEHVLAYPSDLTGLHLHGLNTNSPILTSLPSSAVSSFAKDWGFIPTSYTIFPSVLAVKTYCETVQAAGGIEEKDGSITPVEGFVVRGSKKGGAPGEPFFWKVKYDDPYLMYREWRELTRKLLSAYPDLDGVNPNKLRNEQSRLYLWWVKREMEKDVAKFESWKVGKGIIKTREDFLQWQKTEEAREAMRMLGQQVEDSDAKKKDFDRTLLVPIAVQGCGKTALGLALSHLFGWGHTQSDDFHMKKSGPHFIKSVKELLRTKPVVYADKNNHQRVLRAALASCAKSLEPTHRTRLVALLYPINSPSFPRDKVHVLCASRILSRGQRHQTLRPPTTDEIEKGLVDQDDVQAHEQAIWQFLGQYEEFDQALNGDGDGKFDAVIEVLPQWEKEEQLEKVLEELMKLGGVAGLEDGMPSEERRKEAIAWAEKWEPEKKKVVTKEAVEKKKSKLKVRYYGVSVEVGLKKLVEEALEGNPELRDEEDSTFQALVLSDRVEKSPHVTLVHENEVKPPAPAPTTDDTSTSTPPPPPSAESISLLDLKQSLWTRYSSLIQRAETEARSDLLEVRITLGPRIVWDNRAMAIEVSAMEAAHPTSASDADQIELPTQGSDRQKHAHVTVGTRANEIRPVEGKFLLEAVGRGEKATKEGGEIRVVEMKELVAVKGYLAGLR